MNTTLSRLHPYPFEKLAAIRSQVREPARLRLIDLSIGEPKHETPSFIMDTLRAHLAELKRYPTTRGMPELRTAIAEWLTRRFRLARGGIDPETQVLPVTGTREALFAIAQCVVDHSRPRPVVVMPNPFYQIYEGAALLAGAEPAYLNTVAEHGYEPRLEELPDEVWQRCQLLYLCSPGNPTGALFDLDLIGRVLTLADRHGFVVASDECYSEIYSDEASPPAGLLELAARLGRSDFRRCIIFQSLSKRSSVPGMRSGFVAGDRDIIEQFLRYRTYHGCAMPLYHQAASAAAWGDEEHVRANRAQYSAKFDATLDVLRPVLPMGRPAGGFYLWPELPMDDIEFTRDLLEQQNVLVLPGSFLARETGDTNPGYRRARMALVPPIQDCVEAAQRIRTFLASREADAMHGAARNAG